MKQTICSKELKKRSSVNKWLLEYNLHVEESFRFEIFRLDFFKISIFATITAKHASQFLFNHVLALIFLVGNPTGESARRFLPFEGIQINKFFD